MSSLKEYIKQLAREIMSEESSTGDIGGGAGPIMTPYAFSPEGQKKNAATKTAEKQGVTQTMAKPSAQPQQESIEQAVNEALAKFRKSN